jgi:hypothetical protein
VGFVTFFVEVRGVLEALLELKGFLLFTGVWIRPCRVRLYPLNLDGAGVILIFPVAARL